MASKTENVTVPYSPFHDRMDRTVIKDDNGKVLGVGTAYTPSTGSTKESSELSQERASKDAARRAK